MTMAESSDPESYPAQHEPFGKWLLAQRGCGDWVDDLADAARADRTFPKNGDPEKPCVLTCDNSKPMGTPFRRSTTPRATGRR
ncbi:hypothetical protein [Sphingomonas sp. PB4P5]|uniref:hypothetical protein n=1 Tax=Parasphingomonas puruogangriensis TaxID=3096155 RepID=UPI002FC7BA00